MNLVRKYSICTLIVSVLLSFNISYAAPDLAVTAKPVAKIIDGTIVPQGKWPFITALVSGDSQFDVWSGQFCGGSFIGERYIVTAAHCVNDMQPEDVDVVIGVDE